MTKLIILIFTVILITASDTIAQDRNSKAESTSLIVYFSRTGNTRQLAHTIHSLVGADIVELVPAIEYSADYQETVDRHIHERNSGAFPELRTQIPNLEKYDTIYIGFPNWGNTMPRILFTFLQQHDFSRKTIAPFCTHGGGGLGRSLDDLRAACPTANVVAGLSMRGSSISGAQREVENWLMRTGLQK
ncbi:MAG: flavodoxin [Clostridium sp.]|nr:flavodoxin [Clostridium sp.]